MLFNVTISTTSKVSLLQAAIAGVYYVQENKSTLLRFLFDMASNQVMLRQGLENF